MHTPTAIVPVSNHSSRRTHLVAGLAGIVAIALAGSALADPPAPAAKPGGRHVGAARKAHRADAKSAKAKSGKHSNAAHSAKHAKGKNHAAKSKQVHRMNHAAKNTKHHAKKGANTAQQRTAPLHTAK